jgi:choloylglycine hydrolase
MKILAFLFVTAAAHACTSFQLKSGDGACLYARSMEFGMKLDSEVLIVPRGTSYTGTAPEQKPGLSWKTKYGFIGMNQTFAPTLVSDGMNEKGLVVGLLYLPGFAEYQAPDSARIDKTLGVWELPALLLGTCSTLDQVKSLVPTLLVAQQPMPTMKDFVIPLHLTVSDAKGHSLVIEYLQGKLYIYDNSLGVLTNSPSFGWHMHNLSNYINLSPSNVPALQLGDFKATQTGQGSGLLGLPGDFTPPSRFVRAALFSQWAHTPATALDAVNLGFHILNTFDIFEGIVRGTPPHPFEMTEWTLVHDRTNLKTYIRTYQSLRIQMVDLKKIDFSKSGFRTIPISKTFIPEEIGI